MFQHGVMYVVFLCFFWKSEMSMHDSEKNTLNGVVYIQEAAPRMCAPSLPVHQTSWVQGELSHAESEKILMVPFGKSPQLQVFQITTTGSLLKRTDCHSWHSWHNLVERACLG